jgi:hypothetical protein
MGKDQTGIRFSAASPSRPGDPLGNPASRGTTVHRGRVRGHLDHRYRRRRGSQPCHGVGAAIGPKPVLLKLAYDTRSPATTTRPRSSTAPPPGRSATRPTRTRYSTRTPPRSARGSRDSPRPSAVPPGPTPTPECSGCDSRPTPPCRPPRRGDPSRCRRPPGRPRPRHRRRPDLGPQRRHPLPLTGERSRLEPRQEPTLTSGDLEGPAPPRPGRAVARCRSPSWPGSWPETVSYRRRGCAR